MRLRLLPLLLMSAALPLTALGLAACGSPDRENSRIEQPGAGTTPGTTPGLSRADIEGGLPAPEAVPDAAVSGSAAAAPDPAADTPPDAGLIRLQVLLDRTPFSPGQIDGLRGSNTRQAIEAWRKANNKEDETFTEADLIQALASTDSTPVMVDYVLSPADVAGPFSPPPGDDLSLQAELGTNYSTARERIAERFHVSEALLQALNPGVDFRTAGVKIMVPGVSQATLPEVARIDVSKAEKAIRAYDASGKLIAYYPATIGSGDNPSPSGEVKVNGVARAPDYTFDPARLSFGKGPKVTVPAGPNNPVGAVWIDLDRPSYGIHGTPDPTKVGKTASHGCVRLTNWDAQELAAAVKPGVMVHFR
jgi:lipoprotein-anchoring transpeptidase ErfK/SrfK